MGLPKCCKCNYPFSWRNIFRASFKFSQEIKCPKCGTKMYPTMKSRQKMGIVTFVPLVICFALQVFGLPFKFTMLIFLLLSVLSMILLPFLYSFVDHEEPLW
uniref:TIGR04104 family putative zinc finger protein n=1 Tax=Aeribacillus sp. FSL K6-2833 TaxID=2954611 RepID=UPI00403F71DA